MFIDSWQRNDRLPPCSIYGISALPGVSGPCTAAARPGGADGEADSGRSTGKVSEKQAEGMWTEGNPKKRYCVFPIAAVWVLIMMLAVKAVFSKRQGRIVWVSPGIPDHTFYER